MSTLPSPLRTTLAATLLTDLALGGCSDRELRPLNPCTVSGVAESVKVDNIENVDLLFMIDNSNSMSQEQASLQNEIPRLVRVLAPGDTDEHGTPALPPGRSLHGRGGSAGSSAASTTTVSVTRAQHHTRVMQPQWRRRAIRRRPAPRRATAPPPGRGSGPAAGAAASRCGA